MDNGVNMAEPERPDGQYETIERGAPAVDALLKGAAYLAI
jgi:hypothetical protein